MTPLNDFDEIYSAHAGAVYRVCLRAVSRREVAEDLTSEVFLAFHQNRHKVPPDQLPAWLFTVAKRRAADYWRHHYVEQRWSAAQVEPESHADDPEFSLDLLLERCVALKPVHRVCLVLRFRHGMSRTEIATQTGLSELQIKGHLQYALQLLRKFIDNRPAPTADANPNRAPDRTSAEPPHIEPRPHV